MTKVERLEKLYELKKMIKATILGEQDKEYRITKEHQLKIVEEEIFDCLVDMKLKDKSVNE